MFSAPMFRHEYRSATRGRRPFVFRLVFAAVLGLVALLIGLVVYSAKSGDSDRTRMLYFGRAVFIATVCIEMLFLAFFVASYVGGSVAEEREKDTLPMLLLTRLTSVEIVLTKAVARWLPAINLPLIGLPVLVVAAWAAGLEVESLCAMLLLLSSSAFMATLAILASAQRGQVGTARAQATSWIFVWLFVPPFLSVMRNTEGSLWGDLLGEIKRIGTLIAPSSPLSLVTDSTWYRRVGGLEGRLSLMIGLQAAFGLIMIGLAASRLQAREKNPNWTDPTRGHRPPCGDDPIYWREYELPARRGAGSLFVVRLRFVWIMVRSILISVLTLVAVLLSLAVPVGLLVATLHYGFAAFRELWNHGWGGPFEARSHFNLLIRAATGLLALLPTLSVASLVAGRITTERDKKTWDAFLTTPLTGAEIVRSKARVAAHSLWQAAWPLPILWALGLACGVVLPLGVALSAIDLVLAFWANVALGLYLAIRPGPTNSANSRAATSMLAAFVLHTPLVAALLASPREIAVFDTWSPRLRWGVMLAGLAIMILTGMIARWLTRRTLEHFEEWVGRPVGCKTEGGEK
jgi:ABC-type Na+ efflux pump permease subunit